MEDARAALDLALLKIERGPAYGVPTGESGDRLMEVLTEAGRWAGGGAWWGAVCGRVIMLSFYGGRRANSSR